MLLGAHLDQDSSETLARRIREGGLVQFLVADTTSGPSPCASALTCRSHCECHVCGLAPHNRVVSSAYDDAAGVVDGARMETKESDDAVAHFGVLVRERLVDEEHRRLGTEASGEHHSVAFPVRRLARCALHQMAQARFPMTALVQSCGGFGESFRRLER